MHWEYRHIILAASWISPENAQIIKKEELSYIDTEGNCLLRFGPVLIEKRFPHPKDKEDTLSIFSPKLSRVVRVLLENPSKEWILKDIAEEANISIGSVHKVGHKLLKRGYLVRNPQRKLRIVRAGELLQNWAVSQNFYQNTILGFASKKPGGDIYTDFINYCNLQKEKYAFTLLSALETSKENKIYSYFSGNLSKLEKNLNLKRVSSRANLVIAIPNDDWGVYYRSRKIEGVKVVSKVQLYLDLYSFKDYLEFWRLGEEVMADLRKTFGFSIIKIV